MGEANELGWRLVTKDEFWAAIGNQNVTPRPVGPWPYTSLFKTPAGQVRGKIEDYLPEGSALTKSRYWLPASEVTGCLSVDSERT